MKKDLSYVHKRINIRSYWNTNDNRANDGIIFSDDISWINEVKQPLYLKLFHKTKKGNFIIKF